MTRNCERVVLAGVLLCLCVAVYAAPEEDALWETGANAQKTWQVGLAKFLVTEAPQFKELIELQRDLQLRYETTLLPGYNPEILAMWYSGCR